MLKIKFRIVDDLKILESTTKEKFDREYNMILGYIQICFGEHKEGSYYHENPLREGEEGDELLDWWFRQILETVIIFEQGYDYTAFIEIETPNRWMEFKRNKNDILVNVAIGKAQNNVARITEKRLFSYIAPLDFKMDYNEFKIQVCEAVNKFLMELKEINPCLCNTKMALILKEKLDLIQHS